VAWVFARTTLFQAGLGATFSRLYLLEGLIYLEPGVHAARGFFLCYKGPGH
jgi:hypothetical protein